MCKHDASADCSSASRCLELEELVEEIIAQGELHLLDEDIHGWREDLKKRMQQVQLSRQRNGAYGWSIARDIAEPELWTERYHCPTWHDYLRHRNRPTQSERVLQQQVLDFHIGPGNVRVRRMLEGSVGSNG